jgi:hypothetical protein
MHRGTIKRIAIAVASLGVIATLCALPAAAAGPGYWGEIAMPVFRSDRVITTATAEFRSDENFPRNTFLGRYSTSARFPVTHGWSFRAGYSSFLRGNDLVRLGWQRSLNGGVSYPLGTRRLIGSTIYEHHWLPADRGERDRLRQRVEFTWQRKRVSPWGYEDLTMENGRGPYRSLSRAGLSFDLAGAWQFRAGYQFESLQRRTGAWAPSHAILLQLRLPTLFDRRKRKAPAAAQPSAPKPEPEPDEPIDELDEQ